MSTPSPTYENYPPGRDTAAGAGSEEPPVRPPGLAVPPPPPPPASGPNRRAVLGSVGAGVAVLAALAILVPNRGSSSGEPEASEAADYTEGVSDREAEVGGYTASWPEGWKVDSQAENQLVVVYGDAAVTFRAYIAGDDVTAAEEVQRLLNRHTTGLGKLRTGATTSGTGDPETASGEMSGTRGDDVRVDVSVHVAIDTEDDRDALAVVAVVPSRTPGARRNEITRMRRDFLGQLD